MIVALRGHRGSPRPLRTGRATIVLAVLPFAVLAASSKVTLFTDIESDGSGTRQITAEANAYHLDKGLPKLLDDVQAGAPWDFHWQSETSGSVTLTRDFRSQHLDRLGEDVQLSIEDIVQNPLTIWTTYTWREELKIDYQYVNQPTGARAVGTRITYCLTMPGSVLDASSTTAAAGADTKTTEGRYAVFSLDASQPSHVITATARSVRWMYVIILAYVAAFVLFQVLKFVTQQVSSRPRKIEGANPPLDSEAADLPVPAFLVRGVRP